MRKTKTINVGIAGFGMSAKTFHLPFLILDSRFQVKKVFERRSHHAEQQFSGITSVQEFEALLSDEIDLVVITTPNQTHYDFCKRAILAGKHVIVEKPLTIYAQDASELALLAKEKNVTLSVFQNRRWDNGALTVKQLVKNQTLGDIVDYEIRYERFSQTLNRKQWKETGEFGTGLVYDLGVHLVDHVVDLFGIPTALYADLRCQHEGGKADDNFRITFYYADKNVVMSATKYAREAAPHIILQGKSGSYIKPTLDNQESLLLAGVRPCDNWNQEPETQWGTLHTEINGEIVRHKLESVRGNYQAYYDNIYQVLCENQELIVTPQQAITVLKLIELVYQSAKCGQKIEIIL